MARITKAEREEAIKALRKWLPVGTTVYCIIRRVSASGMSRDISLVYFDPADGGDRHQPTALHKRSAGSASVVSAAPTLCASKVAEWICASTPCPNSARSFTATQTPSNAGRSKMGNRYWILVTDWDDRFGDHHQSERTFKNEATAKGAWDSARRRCNIYSASLWVFPETGDFNQGRLVCDFDRGTQ